MWRALTTFLAFMTKTQKQTTNKTKKSWFEGFEEHGLQFKGCNPSWGQNGCENVWQPATENQQREQGGMNVNALCSSPFHAMQDLNPPLLPLHPGCSGLLCPFKWCSSGNTSKRSSQHCVLMLMLNQIELTV